MPFKDALTKAKWFRKYWENEERKLSGLTQAENGFNPNKIEGLEETEGYAFYWNYGGIWRSWHHGQEGRGKKMSNWIDDVKASRMQHGQKSHGPLDLAIDPRDFIREGVEELIDFLNYWEFAMLQGRVNFCMWNEIDEWVRIALGALREARITPSSPER